MRILTFPTLEAFNAYSIDLAKNLRSTPLNVLRQAMAKKEGFKSYQALQNYYIEIGRLSEPLKLEDELESNHPWQLGMSPNELAGFKFNGLPRSILRDNDFCRETADLVYSSLLGKRLSDPDGHYKSKLYLSVYAYVQDKALEVMTLNEFETLVKEIESQHAYRNTFYLRLLNEIRGRMDRGILDYQRLIYLKKVDRLMWYTFYIVGRNSVFAEAAGIQAHYVAELRLKKPIENPCVDEAIAALERSIK